MADFMFRDGVVALKTILLSSYVSSLKTSVICLNITSLHH